MKNKLVGGGGASLAPDIAVLHVQDCEAREACSVELRPARAWSPPFSEQAVFREALAKQEAAVAELLAVRRVPASYKQARRAARLGRLAEALVRLPALVPT